ncbi:hypothetical protein, partial [Nocardia farcinica]
MSPAAITDRTRSGTEGDLARYLRSRGLQREINDGLNVIESWNRSNSQILWIGSRQATSDTGVSGEGSGVMSTGR